jgi:hypothetical protein
MPLPDDSLWDPEMFDASSLRQSLGAAGALDSLEGSIPVSAPTLAVPRYTGDTAQEAALARQLEEFCGIDFSTGFEIAGTIVKASTAAEREMLIDSAPVSLGRSIEYAQEMSCRMLRD